MMNPHLPLSQPLVLHQRGIALFLSLIALVVMTLAAIALIRSIDTNTLVIGNVGFKQAAVNAADRGSEAAIDWLASNYSWKTNSTSLDNNNSAAGYYATYVADLDPTGTSTLTNPVRIDWNGDSCGSYSGGCIKPSPEQTNADGTVTSYVITRLCRLTGGVNAPSQQCNRPMATANSQNQKRNSINYIDQSLSVSFQGPYYRIIVRAKGARNTVSYTETLVHL